jgi:hypothetical protein
VECAAAAFAAASAAACACLSAARCVVLQCTQRTDTHQQEASKGTWMQVNRLLGAAAAGPMHKPHVLTKSVAAALTPACGTGTLRVIGTAGGWLGQLCNEVPLLFQYDGG